MEVILATHEHSVELAMETVHASGSLNHANPPLQAHTVVAFLFEVTPALLLISLLPLCAGVEVLAAAAPPPKKK